MRVHKVEHCDCFPDGILVWLELTDLPERFQKQAREIDGGNFSPTAFGLCACWDQANRTAELITDTDPEPGNSRNAFYSDTNGEKHWFEISLPPELMDQVHSVCRKEAALALERRGAQNLDRRFTLPPGPVM